MKKISGFSFIHNAFELGIPIIEAIKSVENYVDEMVVVDMESTDETRTMLEKLGVRIIDGLWGNQAGQTLKDAHALHCQCTYDNILHFEGDEVYDENLVNQLIYQINLDSKNLGCWRLQLEQNFQRCRWYPEIVHRVFQKGTVVKEGHSTDYHRPGRLIPTIDSDFGYLWDITNNFHDSWIRRIEVQSELWNDELPQFRHVPLHFLGMTDIHREQAHYLLAERHWDFENTPFKIPEILKPLVGVSDYRNTKHYREISDG